MARILPLTSQRYDYRPDIQLRIIPEGGSGKYELEIIHDDMYRIPLGIDKDDVAVLAETIQERLNAVAQTAGGGLDASEDDLTGPLELLAKAGHRAFKRLLGGGELV